MRGIFALLFIFIALSADLKVTIFPYIHWIAWLLLIFPFMLKNFLIKGFVSSPFLWIGITTLLMGCFTSSFNNSNYESLIQITKFSLIFITMYYFLNYNVVNIKSIFKVINILVIINFIFLLIGYFGIFPTAQLLTSDGRWGTILNYPGSLVKIGTLAFFYNVMLILFVKNMKKALPFIMIVLSLFLIYVDGSRTGILLILLTIITMPLLYILGNNKTNWKVTFMILFSSIIIICMGLMNIKNIFRSRIGESLLAFLNAESFSIALENIDSARYMMLKSAFEKIDSSPIIGSGAFTTIVEYSDGTTMVVHNTYLQFWGDYGLLGLLGLLMIYCGWMYLFPEVIKKFKKTNDVYAKAIVFSSILMLMYYIFNGLFHPYSTEFAEWITFIIPLSAYNTFYDEKEHQINNPVNL